jgi:hypothetical protein
MRRKTELRRKKTKVSRMVLEICSTRRRVSFCSDGRD